MTLLFIVSIICVSIGSSLFVCVIGLILKIGYKYIMYELYGNRDHIYGPRIRNITFNVMLVTMTFAILFFVIGALVYKTNEHNENKQQKINYCNAK